VQSVPKCYKQDKSGVWLVVRPSLASKDVNAEFEGYMVLEFVTRERLVKT
jgi:hypothetical protein